MRKLLIVLAAVVIGLVGLQPALAGVSVTTTNNANDLVGTLLGEGVTVSNATFVGTSTSAGLFTNDNPGETAGTTGLNMAEGILLTSGNAAGAPGPNSSDAYTASNNLAGDSDLNGLIPGYTTHDATVLEFDFEMINDGATLFLNYVFASEEYNEWVGSSYNDVFGLFLDGVNQAKVVTGTVEDNVAINNINNVSHSEWYLNNDPSDTATPFDIEYDGLTVKLQFEVTGLGTGTHHMKLAIADAGDSSYDSAVFLEAGSFGGVDPGGGTNPGDSVPEPATLAIWSVLGGLGMVVSRRRRKAA